MTGPDRCFCRWVFVCLAGVLLVGVSLPVRALEVGLDVQESRRDLLHEDTEEYDTQQVIRETRAFVEGLPTANWRLHLAYSRQDWSLRGTTDDPLMAVELSRLQPRVEYRRDALKLKATALVADLKPKPSLYALDRPEENERFILPGLDAAYTAQGMTYLAGGWRELGFHVFEGLIYTPMVYQTLYLGASYAPLKEHVVEGRLSYTERLRPDNLPLRRQESEVTYRLINPLSVRRKPTWRELTVRLADWHYLTTEADTWFLSVENLWRFAAWGANHVITHRLTGTNAYTVYRTGRFPDSLVEDDKTGTDVGQMFQYTAYAPIAGRRVYGRLTLRLVDSLIQRAYQERELGLGVSVIF